MSRRLRALLSAVTPLGRVVFVTSVLCAVVAVVLDWRETAIIAVMGVVLLGIGALTMIGSLDLSSALVVEPARVVVGDRAAGSMTMTNESSRRSRSVRVELPVGRSTALFQVPRLAPAASSEELFVVPTARRAVIPVGPVTTVLGDPLGLVRRVHTWSDRYEIFVHPKTTVLDTLAAGLVRDLEGQTTQHLTNSDIAFHTLRDYVAGDDRRHVHWKTSAKIGKLMVRQYVDTRRSHLCVLLSTDPAEFANEDEFEVAVSAAASLCLQALRDEQTLTLVVGGDQLSVHGGKALLDRFSGVELTPGGGGIDLCFAAARKCAPDASVTAVASGSVPTVANVKRASARMAIDTRIIAVLCDTTLPVSYRLVGSTAFVRLDDVASLRRSLAAVL